MDISCKSLWKTSLPIFSFLLIENIIAFMDTAFLGRVNESQLAAAAIAGLFYVSVFIVGFGFSVGAQIMISHANGAREYSKIGGVWTTALGVLVVMAFVSLAASAFFGEAIFSKMVSEPDVLNDVLRYMKWRQIGFIPIFCVVAFRAFYVGIADTRVLAYSSLTMGAVNGVLNYALIFGKWGFPEMQIEGAALASTLSEFAALGLFVAWTYCGGYSRKFGLKFSCASAETARKIFSLSVWTMAQQFVYVGMWLLLFAYFEKFGRHELAQSNIFKSILMFLYMPMYAFGATMNTVAGNLAGEGRQGEVPKACARIIGLEYALTLPALAVVALLPDVFLLLYTDSGEILEGAHFPFYCALFTVPFSIPAITLSNVMLGLEKTRATFVIEFSSLFLYFGGILFTVYVLRSFGATWTLDAWYWLVVAAADVYYIKRRRLFEAVEK